METGIGISTPLNVWENGQQKNVQHQTCLAKIRLLTGLNVGGETRSVAIQLVLQQCCKTNCTFFVARFAVPLDGGWNWHTIDTTV